MGATFGPWEGGSSVIRSLSARKSKECIFQIKMASSVIETLFWIPPGAQFLDTAREQGTARLLGRGLFWTIFGRVAVAPIRYTGGVELCAHVYQ